MSIGKDISDFIFEKGIETLFNECNCDLKDVRNKIIRELNIKKGTDISRAMRKIKNFVHKITGTSCNSTYIQEFLQKLNGGL